MFINAGEPGDRLRLIEMESGELPPGSEGTIVGHDPHGNPQVEWDDGTELNLLIECDSWELIESNPVHPDHQEDDEDDDLRETEYP